MTNTFGIVVRNDEPGVDITTLSRATVMEQYRTAGAVLFRGFRTDIKSYDEFSAWFVDDCVVNGNETRQRVVPDRHIETVNTGFNAIPLHAEMAYSPLRPDMLFFYCMAPSRKPGGETLLCDGIEVWSRMQPSTRSLFEGQMVRYTFENSRLLGAQCEGREVAFRSDRRVRRFESHPDGTADVDFVTPAAQTPKHSSAYAFANSVIVEDKSASFEDGSPITRDLRLELFALTVTLSYRLAWAEGDVLMVDNSRIMHGRTQIGFQDERRIVLKMGRELT